MKITSINRKESDEYNLELNTEPKLTRLFLIISNGKHPVTQD